MKLSFLRRLVLFIIVLNAQAEPPILRVSMEQKPTTLQWREARSPTDRYIATFLMRGLMQEDAQGEIKCALCRQVEISSDELLVSFRIDTKNKWVDGTTLHAQHFVDGLKALAQSKIPDAQAFFSIEGFSPFNAKKFGVRAAAADKLTIRLKKKDHYLLHRLTLPAAFPKFQDLSLGPYFLAAWEKKRGRIVLEGNPEYTGPRPVYRVEFYISDHQKAVESFTKGRLDVLNNPTTTDILKLRSKSKLQLSPYWATRLLVFNFKNSQLAKVEFRKAILSSLNKPKLPGFVKSGEQVSQGLIPQGIEGHRKIPPKMPFDLARAQSYRHRVLKWPLKLNQKLLVPRGSAEEQVAQWIVQQLSAIKVEVALEKVDPDQYWRRLRSGEFEMAVLTWSFSMASPLDLLEGFRTDALTNYGKWVSSSFDLLLSRLNEESDPARRSKTLERILELFESVEVPAIPLSHPSKAFMLGERVERFLTTPFGHPDLVKIKLKSN